MRTINRSERGSYLSELSYLKSKTSAGYLLSHDIAVVQSREGRVNGSFQALPLPTIPALFLGKMVECTFRSVVAGPLQALMAC